MQAYNKPYFSSLINRYFLFFGGGGRKAFTARQDYFIHFEPGLSLGGAKTGDPQEKTSDHPQAELGMSHNCDPG